jgi:hypothetical protein
MLADRLGLVGIVALSSMCFLAEESAPASRSALRHTLDSPGVPVGLGAMEEPEAGPGAGDRGDGALASVHVATGGPDGRSRRCAPAPAPGGTPRHRPLDLAPKQGPPLR